MFKFSTKSINNLNTVDKKLYQLANEVLKISNIDFGISEGLRTLKTQQEYYKQGKSQCDGINQKSKHQEGKAIDIICYINNKITWDNKYYYYIAGLFESKAKELNINIRWGGWWTFEDCVHFELI